MTEDASRWPEFDEVRAISLPPPQTAAVNRLLREESGWVLLDARVSQPGSEEPMVVYVVAHRKDTKEQG